MVETRTENGCSAGERNSCGIKILIADDEPGARMALEVALRLSGFSVVSVENGEKALEAGRKASFDLLLTDVYMPGMTGIELIENFRAVSPATEIVVMTAQGSLETAMSAVEHGAFDFIAKPFDIDAVLAVVRRATENLGARPTESGDGTHDFSASGIVGHSAPMVQVYKLVAYAARTDSTVLIEGETGTGKELVARAIHRNSARAERPFTTVNCSALTETLLESELFGFTKGSFTGAMNDRAGLFEATNGGTIFLDEISSASPSLQASLLRVLQEKEVRRVGSRETRRIDVRVVAASNSKLEQMVARGSFRADLFYRLSVLTIPLPTLGERGREDLELLTRHFLRRHGGSALMVADGVFDALSRHDWIGNVRELENALEYAVAVCSGHLVTPDDLPPRFASASEHRPSGSRVAAVLSFDGDRPTLDELSRRYAELVLAECSGNKSRAAEILGINRRTLYRYLVTQLESDPCDESDDDDSRACERDEF